jgi:NAD(P)-dependent dehydrogenase (short-subunit alcohol dehydrogenase family)
VNNAGICGSQLFEDATLDDFDHYWRSHLGAPVNTVKAAWPHMVTQRHGKIILTTSVSGLFGLRGQATYAAAKCAVGYTRMHPAAGSRLAEADGRAAMPPEAVAPAIVW